MDVKIQPPPSLTSTPCICCNTQKQTNKLQKSYTDIPRFGVQVLVHAQTSTLIIISENYFKNCCIVETLNEIYV